MKRLLLPALCAFGALSLLGPQSHAQAPAAGTGTGNGTTTGPSTGAGAGTGSGAGAGLGGRRRGGAAEAIEKRAREIVKKYDKDGDGALNATELAAYFEAMHQRIEERKGQSGSASTTSSNATTQPGQGTALEHAQKAIEKFDKNGDGKLEPRELAAFLMAWRERLMHQRGEGGQGAGQVAPATTTPTTPPPS